MTTRRRRALTAVALMSGLALAACEKKAVESPRQQARAVTVTVVRAREIEGGLVASGVLTPREDTAVFPQINGYRVVEVLADEGDWVKAGQPLARMDDTLLRSQLSQQTALAVEQRVAAKRADAEAARVKGLDGEGLLSQEQVDTRRFAALSAHAQADAQDAAVNDVKTRETLMIVRAPCDGLVIERTVRLGDVGGGTTPWFRIAKDGQVELAAEVGEETLNKLRIGAHATVSLADGTQVDGVIRLISPSVGTGTRLGKVRVALPVRPDIHAGGFARASFIGATRSALSVPETAVRYDADGASVMLVGPDEKVSRVPVTTGQRGGGYVELLTGPTDGARVVARASTMLVPGDVVRPVDAS